LRGKAPELDAAAALGSKCGISDAAAVFQANLICTEHGLDPVAAGGTIACAMELASLGLMTDAPSFGDAAAMLKALEAMGKGSGKLTAGAAQLCTEAGRPESFMGRSAKGGGSELPALEVRAIPAMGLHFASTGIAPHELSAFGIVKRAFERVSSAKASPAESAAQCLASQEEAAVMDSLGLCVLPLLGVGLDDLLPLLPAATGWDASKEELLAIGRGILQTEREWSRRAGVGLGSLPKRLTSEPLDSGPAAGKVCALDALQPEYERLFAGAEGKRAVA
jgi:aldehyde:ferredoxin oxidoreductase